MANASWFVVGYSHNPYNGVVCNDTILATGVFSSKELWRLSKGNTSFIFKLFYFMTVYKPPTSPYTGAQLCFLISLNHGDFRYCRSNSYMNIDPLIGTNFKLELKVVNLLKLNISYG